MWVLQLLKPKKDSDICISTCHGLISTPAIGVYATTQSAGILYIRQDLWIIRVGATSTSWGSYQMVVAKEEVRVIYEVALISGQERRQCTCTCRS